MVFAQLAGTEWRKQGEKDRPHPEPSFRFSRFAQYLSKKYLTNTRGSAIITIDLETVGHRVEISYKRRMK
jgi:hypothetical protein